MNRLGNKVLVSPPKLWLVWHSGIVRLINLWSELANEYCIIKWQFILPRTTISRYFTIVLLIRLFFAHYRSKKSRRKSFSRMSRFLMSKKIVKAKNCTFESHESSQMFAGIKQKSLSLDVLYVNPQVTCRSHLSQNSKILYRCFKKRLLQNWHEIDQVIKISRGCCCVLSLLGLGE